MVLLLPVLSCTQQAGNSKAYTIAIDSLQRQVNDIKENYRPGLGEIMIDIQMHHGKLWFAGKNNNWKLAAYEIGELKEMFTAAGKLETDRPEVKDIPAIYPAVDSLALAITQQNARAFKESFQVLTNTCNTCHREHHFEFNVISIPASPPVTNQDFSVH